MFYPQTAITFDVEIQIEDCLFILVNTNSAVSSILFNSNGNKISQSAFRAKSMCFAGRRFIS